MKGFEAAAKLLRTSAAGEENRLRRARPRGAGSVSKRTSLLVVLMSFWPSVLLLGLGAQTFAGAAHPGTRSRHSRASSRDVHDSAVPEGSGDTNMRRRGAAAHPEAVSAESSRVLPGAASAPSSLYDNKLFKVQAERHNPSAKARRVALPELEDAAEAEAGEAFGRRTKANRYVEGERPPPPPPSPVRRHDPQVPAPDARARGLNSSPLSGWLIESPRPGPRAPGDRDNYNSRRRTSKAGALDWDEFQQVLGVQLSARLPQTLEQEQLEPQERKTQVAEAVPGAEEEGEGKLRPNKAVSSSSVAQVETPKPPKPAMMRAAHAAVSRFSKWMFSANLGNVTEEKTPANKYSLEQDSTDNNLMEQRGGQGQVDEDAMLARDGRLGNSKAVCDSARQFLKKHGDPQPAAGLWGGFLGRGRSSSGGGGNSSAAKKADHFTAGEKAQLSAQRAAAIRDLQEHARKEQKLYGGPGAADSALLDILGCNEDSVLTPPDPMGHWRMQECRSRMSNSFMRYVPDNGRSGKRERRESAGRPAHRGSSSGQGRRSSRSQEVVAAGAPGEAKGHNFKSERSPVPTDEGRKPSCVANKVELDGGGRLRPDQSDGRGKALASADRANRTDLAGTSYRGQERGVRKTELLFGGAGCPYPDSASAAGPRRDTPWLHKDHDRNRGLRGGIFGSSDGSDESSTMYDPSSPSNTSCSSVPSSCAESRPVAGTLLARTGRRRSAEGEALPRDLQEEDEDRCSEPARGAIRVGLQAEMCPGDEGTGGSLQTGVAETTADSDLHHQEAGTNDASFTSWAAEPQEPGSSQLTKPQNALLRYDPMQIDDDQLRSPHLMPSSDPECGDILSQSGRSHQSIYMVIDDLNLDDAKGGGGSGMQHPDGSAPEDSEPCGDRKDMLKTQRASSVEGNADAAQVDTRLDACIQSSWCAQGGSDELGDNHVDKQLKTLQLRQDGILKKVPVVAPADGQLSAALVGGDSVLVFASDPPTPTSPRYLKLERQAQASLPPNSRPDSWEDGAKQGPAGFQLHDFQLGSSASASRDPHSQQPSVRKADTPYAPASAPGYPVAATFALGEGAILPELPDPGFPRGRTTSSGGSEGIGSPPACGGDGFMPGKDATAQLRGRFALPKRADERSGGKSATMGVEELVNQLRPAELADIFGGCGAFAGSIDGSGTDQLAPHVYPYLGDYVPPYRSPRSVASEMCSGAASDASYAAESPRAAYDASEGLASKLLKFRKAGDEEEDEQVSEVSPELSPTATPSAGGAIKWSTLARSSGGSRCQIERDLGQFFCGYDQAPFSGACHPAVLAKTSQGITDWRKVAAVSTSPERRAAEHQISGQRSAGGAPLASIVGSSVSAAGSGGGPASPRGSVPHAEAMSEVEKPPLFEGADIPCGRSAGALGAVSIDDDNHQTSAAGTRGTVTPSPDPPSPESSPDLPSPESPPRPWSASPYPWTATASIYSYPWSPTPTSLSAGSSVGPPSTSFFSHSSQPLSGDGGEESDGTPPPGYVSGPPTPRSNPNPNAGAGAPGATATGAANVPGGGGGGTQLGPLQYHEMQVGPAGWNAMLRREFAIRANAAWQENYPPGDAEAGASSAPAGAASSGAAEQVLDEGTTASPTSPEPSNAIVPRPRRERTDRERRRVRFADREVEQVIWFAPTTKEELEKALGPDEEVTDEQADRNQ